MSDRIVEQIAREFGVLLTHLEPLDGGNDASAQAFRGVTADLQSFFVKRVTRLEPGIALSAALWKGGNSSVLAPLPTLAGEDASIADDGALLLYPFVEGASGFERKLELRHWLQLGRALRGVHDTTLSEDISSRLPVETFAVEGVDRFISTSMRLLARETRTKAEADLADLIGDNRGDIEEAIDRVRRLGRACSWREWHYVPSHADLHVGNILVDTHDTVHIVDWDNPRLAPRECDLMFMVFGGILWAHGEAEERSFFEGYGETEMDAQLIAYYRYARVVEDFVADCEEITNPAKFVGANPENALERFATVLRGTKRLNEEVPASS